MRYDIGRHYSNDDKRLYEFSRKAEPLWYPKRGLGPDGYVMIATVILAICALIFVYLVEGGL